MTLPLHPVVLEILERNNCNFPKKITSTEHNLQIKRIAKDCRLEKHIKARKRTAHRTKNTIVQKYEALSSHIGRRSFCNYFLRKNSYTLLMEATGHYNRKNVFGVYQTC